MLSVQSSTEDQATLFLRVTPTRDETTDGRNSRVASTGKLWRSCMRAILGALDVDRLVDLDARANLTG